MKDNFKEKYDNVVKYLKANVLTDRELCLTVLCSFLAGVIVGMVASPKKAAKKSCKCKCTPEIEDAEEE